MRHEGGTVRANLARLAGDAQRPVGEEESQMNTDGQNRSGVRSAIRLTVLERERPEENREQ